MDVEHAEMVEKQLDAMIQRRARKGDVDPDEAEEIWKESVRQYNARRREENRREWCGYFERLAASLRARAEEYDQRAQTLMEQTNRKEQRDGQGEIRQRLLGRGGNAPEDARQLQGFCGPLSAFPEAGPRACRPCVYSHGPIERKGLEVEMGENVAGQASLTEQIIRPSVEEIHASIPHKGVCEGSV